MSFFHLTQLGYEKRFRSMENLNSIGSRQSGNKLQNSYDKQRIREVLGDYQSREWSTPAISNM